MSESTNSRKYVLALSIAAALFVGCASTMLAQTAGGGGGGGGVTTPPSSNSSTSDAGVRAHTNIQFLSSPGHYGGNPQSHGGPPFPGYFYEDPASLACIYNLQQSFPGGCNPNFVFQNPYGGRKAIAIVDAFDDPNAYADLQGFAAQFGVAPINPSSFIVVYAPSGGATGTCTGPATEPPVDPTGGWEVEEALDIEYSHSMAPEATLYLVEAQSNYDTDLFCAVSVASSLVQKAGGGEVSMSWGGGEFPAETAYDSLFTTPGVVYFAAAGDSPGTIWPSVSPNVVAVGGTTLSTNPVSGTFLGENGWQVAGGGPSAYESRPSYQNGIARTVGDQRGVPDVSLDANPSTGVWVLDHFMAASTCGGTPCWYVVGGTSVSTPTWAGIVNAAGSFSASSNAELTKLYREGEFGFNDITLGSCGLYMGYFASPGWDFCTGLGSPSSYFGK
jgi:subtilase family serine protease